MLRFDFIIFSLTLARLVLESTGLVVKNAKGSVSESTRQQKTADANSFSPCLDGKTIVFIGPSTSKADYLALTYFAEYGRWPDGDEVNFGAPGQPARKGPNPIDFALLEYEQNIAGFFPQPPARPNCRVGSGQTFYSYSNALFNGHEFCDCYKNNPGGEFQIADVYNQTENRIYTKGSTTIAYFQWFGETVAPRGTVDFTPLSFMPVQQSTLSHLVQACPAGQFKGSFEWKIPMQHFVANFVRSLKPTHLVIDAAYWPIARLTSSMGEAYMKFWDELASAGKAAVQEKKGSVFWRTVPIRSEYPISEPSSQIDRGLFLNHGWELWDARTVMQQYKGARPDNDIYADAVHLRPHSESHLMWSFLQGQVCRSSWVR